MDQLPFPDTMFDLVVIASSAGGLNSLTQVLMRLPGNFPAALLIAQHLQPGRLSLFPDLLGKKTRLLVRQAKQGMVAQPGMAFLSPPGVHMLVQSDLSLVIVQGDAQELNCPSADRLFLSAVACCGARTIGVVLSGMGEDGSRGVAAIHAARGRVIAQSPATSKYSSMPQAAIQTGSVDYVLPLVDISAKILALIHGESAA